MVSEDAVYRALRNVIEPGLAETVVNLGLIYRVHLQSPGSRHSRDDPAGSSLPTHGRDRSACPTGGAGLARGHAG